NQNAAGLTGLAVPFCPLAEAKIWKAYEGRNRWLYLAIGILLLGIISPQLSAQTYIETTTKGPTSNAACDAIALTDSFLLSSTTGTATTKSFTLSASSSYAIGFTTASGVPGLTSWQPSTYALGVENTTTNANIQVFDVCFSRVNSTGSVLNSSCQAAPAPVTLSSAAV